MSAGGSAKPTSNTLLTDVTMVAGEPSSALCTLTQTEISINNFQYFRSGNCYGHSYIHSLHTAAAHTTLLCNVHVERTTGLRTVVPALTLRLAAMIRQHVREASYVMHGLLTAASLGMSVRPSRSYVYHDINTGHKAHTFVGQYTGIDSHSHVKLRI